MHFRQFIKNDAGQPILNVTNTTLLYSSPSPLNRISYWLLSLLFLFAAVGSVLAQTNGRNTSSFYTFAIRCLLMPL